MQETLVALHTRRDTYDPNYPLTAWMYAIARYRLIDFLRRAGLANRVIGAVGVVAGAVPAAMLLSGQATMELRVAFPVYSAHAVWAILVAIQMVRRKI